MTVEGHCKFKLIICNVHSETCVICLLPIRGEVEDMIGNSLDKYIKKMQTIMQAMPFNNNFSPACGGSQKATKVMNTTTIAGTIAIALNIGDWRRKFSWNALENKKVNYNTSIQFCKNFLLIST